MHGWTAKIKSALDFLSKGATRVGLLYSCSVCRSSRQQDAACDLEFMATVKLFTMVVILSLESVDAIRMAAILSTHYALLFYS